ncbi:lipase member H-A-like [Anthonomus grandis grandis]|uniref:lipase member H-A-like n=1 Tax=Anthonomus grandis grandis TaxID=2921223 RepID=UPI002166816A|nr:lipase member H-A-like [Anthonomus grandis grandis]
MSDKQRYRSYPKVDFEKHQFDDPLTITYKLFVKENGDQPVRLVAIFFTTIFFHGWTSSEKSPWYDLIKQAYFQKADHNIIFVDWSTYGNMSYHVSSANVKPVGDAIANFLIQTRLRPDKIHLIGYSLGSQLAGFVGKAYENLGGKKVGRITALDPAGPMWGKHELEERLCQTDAEFVDVVHTDIQMFGYTNPCGHVDFYPNGGTDQPGCEGTSPEENCNHRRAPALFIESINSQIVATEIDIYEDEQLNVVINRRENPKRVVFGEGCDPEARGVFYFETRAHRPYLNPSWQENK